MKLTTVGKSVVNDVQFGVFVAMDEEGRYIVDEEYNHLSIAAEYGDEKRIKELRDAAKSYGFNNIKVEFRPGARKITEEEYEEQRLRQQFGLVPDPQDVGVALDEYRDGTV